MKRAYALRSGLIQVLAGEYVDVKSGLTDLLQAKVAKRTSAARTLVWCDGLPRRDQRSLPVSNDWVEEDARDDEVTLCDADGEERGNEAGG